LTHLDLEGPADREKPGDAALCLSGRTGELVIIREVERAPELFRTLRTLIATGRRLGICTGRFPLP